MCLFIEDFEGWAGSRDSKKASELQEEEIPLGRDVTIQENRPGHT